MHPASTSAQTAKVNIKFLDWLGEALVENKNTYNISENASNMLWIEHFIVLGKEAGTVTTDQERQWVRKLYAEKLFNDPARVPNTREEARKVVESYAAENPPPIDPQAEGADVLVPQILVDAIEGFAIDRPVYAATDDNGWLVLGGSKANAAILARTEMKREGLFWRAKGMRGVRFHPAQLKNVTLANPFTGSNVSWAKIENVYANWSERSFVDTSGSGPSLLVR